MNTEEDPIIGRVIDTGGRPAPSGAMREVLRGLLAVVTLRQLIWVMLLVAALGSASWWIGIDEVHAHARKLNGPAVFGLITLLPLIGFPVGVLHVTAGMRFSPAVGFALVATSILLQLVASYAIVRAMPGFFARRLEPVRRRLPRAAHRPLTFFTLLLPGLPYAMQLYVLPLVRVPFRTFIGCSLPIHVARSIVSLSFGGLSDDLTPARLAGFGLYTITLLVMWAWSFRCLRARLSANQPAEEGDRRPLG